MNRINVLYNFLVNKKLLKEASFILKLSKQIDYGIDQNPFLVEMSKDVKVQEGMVESETESCNLVNFGIENIQNKYADKMLKKTKYFPEEINLVHFDISKLINCMIINEKSKKDLMELGYSLSQERAGSRVASHSIKTFSQLFNKYPNIQKAFDNAFSEDKINYVLIGTSDKTRNFIGSERGAQLFHQNTKKHVIHDLAHALYDIPGITQRNMFTPIEIMVSYISDVLKEYNKYLSMYNTSATKSKSLINFFKSFLGGKEEKERKTYRLFSEDVNLLTSYNRLHRHLIEANKFYDLRYLVGTNNNKPKAFTDKSDFDQDFFYYIIDSEGVYDLENDKLLNVFKDPKLPPRMERFFDRFFPDKGYKEDLQKKVEEMHKKAMRDIQIDLDKMTHEDTGYVSFLASLSSSKLRGSVFIFNMLSPTINFIEKAISDKLESMGYTERPKGTEYLVQTEKTGRVVGGLDGMINEEVVDEEGKKGKLIFVGDLSEDQKKRWLKGMSSVGNYQYSKHGDVFYVNDIFLNTLNSSIFQDKLNKYFNWSDHPIYTIQKNTSKVDGYPHTFILNRPDDSGNFEVFLRKGNPFGEDSVKMNMEFTVLFLQDIKSENIKIAPTFKSIEDEDFDLLDED